MLLALLALVCTQAPPTPSTAINGAAAKAEGPRDPFAVYDDSPQHGDGVLEQWALDRLVLEGVLISASPRALIRTPDGRSHTARIGDPIGKRLGRITSIKPGTIEVKELVRGLDQHGAYVVREEKTTLRTAPLIVRKP